MIRTVIYIAAVAGVLSLFACSPRNISTKFYYENEPALDSIEESYKRLYEKQPFTLAFTDRYFQSFALEVITDTLTYVYEFRLPEIIRFRDTLRKYRLDVAGVSELLDNMRSVRTTWINNYDYYVDGKRQSLIYLSIKPVAVRAPLTSRKYYILTYFNQPQSFDAVGRLLDKKALKRLRKINGEVLHRINDKVCYTVSARFR